jgi:predicted transcriptional regulator
MASTKPIQSNGELVRELDAIKRLLILQLLNSGTKQAEIAKALGISEATMSRMMPGRQSSSRKLKRES